MKVIQIFDRFGYLRTSDGEPKQVSRAEAFQWFEENYESVRDLMIENEMRLEPRELPSLTNKFRKYKDEL